MVTMRQGGAGVLLAEVGWYGKIPAAGDFLHRRVSREVIAWWDKWLQLSLSGAWSQADGLRRAYAQAPMWNFVVPAGAGPGQVQLGCIAASHDRVGRRYPVCAVLELPADDYTPALLDGAAGFFRQLGMALMGAVRNGYGADQLEHAVDGAAGRFSRVPAPRSDGGGDIMSILDPQGAGLTSVDRLAWGDLPLCFNPHAHTSYWWTNQVDGAPLRTYVHGGALNASLFSTLFVPAAGARRDAWTPR